MAQKLDGRQTDYEKYIESSSNWETLFKADPKSFNNDTGADTGFTGFFPSKHLNQTWGF